MMRFRRQSRRPRILSSEEALAWNDSAFSPCVTHRQDLHESDLDESDLDASDLDASDPHGRTGDPGREPSPPASYSITSSALASRTAGMARPRALAVLRLIVVI